MFHLSVIFYLFIKQVFSFFDIIFPRKSHHYGGNCRAIREWFFARPLIKNIELRLEKKCECIFWGDILTRGLQNVKNTRIPLSLQICRGYGWIHQFQITVLLFSQDCTFQMNVFFVSFFFLLIVYNPTRVLHKTIRLIFLPKVLKFFLI